MAAQSRKLTFFVAKVGVLLQAKGLEDVPYGSVPHGGNPGLDLSLLIVMLAVRSLNLEGGDFFSVERFSGN